MNWPMSLNALFCFPILVKPGIIQTNSSNVEKKSLLQKLKQKQNFKFRSLCFFLLEKEDELFFQHFIFLNLYGTQSNSVKSKCSLTLYNDHHRDPKFVAIVDRRSLFRESFTFKNRKCKPKNGGRCRQGVVIRRWLLTQD